MISLSDGVENIMREGEMLATSIFSFSHNIFKSSLFSGLLKVEIVWYRVQYGAMVSSVFDREESTVGKGEKAVYLLL